MITRQAIGTLFDLFKVKRIKQIVLGANTAYVALLRAEHAPFNVLYDPLNNAFEAIVVVALFYLKKSLNGVDLGRVNDKVVEVSLEFKLEFVSETTRVYVRPRVVQFEAQLLNLRKSAIVLE
jgi:hypothetical protein